MSIGTPPAGAPLRAKLRGCWCGLLAQDGFWSGCWRCHVLRSFRVGNHRSFREEQELLLMPAYDKERLVLPVAAIYGANASGKSNLLDALKFMVDAVRDSLAAWPADGGVPRHPFRLDRLSRDRPSIFVLELVVGGVRYTYGFEVDSDRIRAEWLYSYPEKRKRVIFERELDEVVVGSTVTDLRGKLELVKALLRPNALFLSLTAQLGIDVVWPVYRWFSGQCSFRLGGSVMDENEVINFFLGNPDLRRKIDDLVRVADFGVSSLVVIGSDNGVEYDLFDEAAGRHVDGLRRSGKVVNRQAGKRRGEYRINLLHGHREVFELADESAGTKSWLALLPAVLRTLEYGGALVVDEIDASLHPRLTARLVALFRDRETNPNSAQLIFTTHDASLLSPVLGEEVLKRDEIWFVEKGEEGGSEIYSLTDFHPRKEGENLERRYLGGSYGAVPKLLEEDFVDVLRGEGGPRGSA